MNHLKNQPLLWLFPTLLVLYEIAVYLSNDMYLPALPTMMQDLALSTTQAQLTITMWFVGTATMPLLIGIVADRFGRRPTLLIGGIIYVLATMACALAVDEYTLLIPRIIEGTMVSSMLVAGYAAIHEQYDHKEAIRILAIMGGVSVLAPALGPLGGAFILLAYDWRWIFWIIAAFASILLICLYYHMPETLLAHQRQPLHVKKILQSYWRVVTSRQFLMLLAILGFTFAGFIGWITAGPLLVIQSLNYSAVAFGWMQAAVFAAYIIGSYLVNQLLEKHDAIRLVNSGLIISLIAGLFIAIFAYWLPHQFYLFLIAIIVFSFGSALCFPPLNRLIIETSQEPMGTRVALFTTGLMCSGIVGSGVASLVYDGTPFSLGILMTISILIACTLQLWLTLTKD